MAARRKLHNECTVKNVRRMDYIPGKLNLQMDNCWRENKNQFVIVFLALLVKRKVFRKVLKQVISKVNCMFHLKGC